MSSIHKRKNEEDNTQSNKKQRTLTCDTSLLVVPIELIESITSYLSHLDKNNFSWYTNKQLRQLLTQSEVSVKEVMLQYISKVTDEPELMSQYFHEAFLAGWILDNYNGTLTDKSDDDTIIHDRDADESYAVDDFPGTLFCSCLEKDVDLKYIQGLLEKCALYSKTRNTVYTEECMKNMIAHFDTEVFQIYSRLLSYSVDAKYPLVPVHNPSLCDTIIKPRLLNFYEKKLFKFTNNDVTQTQVPDSSKPLVHSSEQFLKNMNEQFCLDLWKDYLDWNNHFLVGGSVLKCLLYDSFSASSDQDLDLFWTGYDYYEWENQQEQFYDALRVAGYKVQYVALGYVRAMKVTFNEKKQVTFQFIWYDDNLSRERILHVFDLDCCMVGYNGQRVLSTWSFIQALNTGTMISYKLVENEKDARHYLPRAMKYSKRGFKLLVPDSASDEHCDNLTRRIAKDDDDEFDTENDLDAIKESYTGFLLNNDTFRMREKFVALMKGELKK
jgi:hypothetical protein